MDDEIIINPHRICDDCGIQDHTVIKTTCPIEEELRDVEVEVVLCPDCRGSRSMEV